MFAPSSDHVRRFFCEVQRKRTHGELLLPMESLAAEWVEQHPEYQAELNDVEHALQRRYALEEGRTNPFLHLSMHLSISEQTSIDQPHGIREAVEQLAAKLGSLHAAHHEVMECLGVMIWESQRSGLPPDGQTYIEQVHRRLAQL